MSVRSDKVSSIIQQQLGILMQELELPFLTTISKVEVTADLKWAKVWITVLPAGEDNEKQILEVLHKNMYDLQGGINNYFEMKIVPRVSFVIDHSQEYASHINELIKKTHEQDEN